MTTVHYLSYYTTHSERTIVSNLLNVYSIMLLANYIKLISLK